MYYILFTRLSDNLQIKLKNESHFNSAYRVPPLFETPKHACGYVESHFDIDCYIDDVAHDRKNGWTFQIMKVGLSE